MKYVLKNTHTDHYLHFFHSAMVWNIVQSAERLTQEEWTAFLASHDMNLKDGYELVPATGLKYQMPLQRTSFSMYKQKVRIDCKKCLGKFGFEEIIAHRETCKYKKPKPSKKPRKPIKTPGVVVEMDLTPRTPVDIQINSDRGRLKRGYVSCSGCLNRVYISTKYADTSLGPAFICPDCKAILRPKDAMSYRVGRKKLSMQIGKKTRVQDVRTVWKKENDFSDWLVTEDGMSLLSEELGIEVENLRREVRAGDYPCDIVGNLLGDEHHVVVIENQYGKTDHDHLGKLLTYAAVHKATTGIWISETISDDHRKVIDWLNENTPDNVNLYLVGLKLYRIGNSPVAPQLDVVCRPNREVKVVNGTYTPGDIERREWRVQMWTRIGEVIRAKSPTFRLQKPSGDHWSSIAIGRSGFCLSMLLNARNKNIGVEIVITVEWKADAFNILLEQKDDIESILGPLEWLPLEDKKSAKIIMFGDIDPKDPTKQDEVDAWFAVNVQRFYDVFKDRVARLESP